MRLWHIDLIKVLPDQQIKGEWRELNAIFKAKKPINHLLINFHYNYPKAVLLSYSVKVVTEMRRRGYKCNVEAMTAYFSVADYEQAAKITVPFAEKMNDEYLTQCFFNLQEKFDCGGITDGEWAAIYYRFTERVKSWVSNNL